MPKAISNFLAQNMRKNWLKSIIHTTLPSMNEWSRGKAFGSNYQLGWCGIEKVSNIKSPKLSDPRIYSEIVGSLIYVMTATRPDLCYIVTKLSQKMSEPTVAYLGAAKHVLRYLKGYIRFRIDLYQVSFPINTAYRFL